MIVHPKAPDFLRKARERIGVPQLWFKGVWSDNGYGGIWFSDSCLCVDAALLSVVPEFGLLPAGASLCLTLAARARGFETASKLNDAPTTTHADVLALLDEAIALAESMLTVPS